MFDFLKPIDRPKVADTPFPDAWREILMRRFALYRRLNDADRKELESRIQVFLAEKQFEGCGGLEITDEIRTTIAAQACLLLLHRSADCYSQLKSILVYPSTYFARSVQHGAGGVVSEEESVRLGESWNHGAVVLAWDSVNGGAANPFDGHNVVLHEFAHQLDQEDGQADGAPRLARGKPFFERIASYSSWARILNSEYKDLREATEKGRKSVLDKYGATNPAEFFAVATECFFEKPQQMLKKHPALYEELKQFYCQDPANWHDTAAS